MPPPILTQFTFDLANGNDGYTLRPLARIPGELPRTDDRYQGHGYQHGYMVAGRGADGSSSVGHVDHNTGKMECWSPGPASAVQESQFVPRRPDSTEGDGYLLTVVNRLAENHSDLAVLDARNVSRRAGRAVPACQSACAWPSTELGFPPRRSAPAVTGWRSRNERPGNELICGNSFEASVPS